MVGAHGEEQALKMGMRSANRNESDDKVSRSSQNKGPDTKPTLNQTLHHNRNTKPLKGHLQCRV